jgi:hypothetical protein
MRDLNFFSEKNKFCNDCTKIMKYFIKTLLYYITTNITAVHKWIGDWQKVNFTGDTKNNFFPYIIFFYQTLLTSKNV